MADDSLLFAVYHRFIAFAEIFFISGVTKRVRQTLYIIGGKISVSSFFVWYGTIEIKNIIFINYLLI